MTWHPRVWSATDSTRGEIDPVYRAYCLPASPKQGMFVFVTYLRVMCSISEACVKKVKHLEKESRYK